MSERRKDKHGFLSRPRRMTRLLPRIARSRDGAAAIEFALLAIPYFMIIFAIFETFIAFTGEQLVSNAVDTMARKLRTGEIAYAGTVTDQDRKTFREDFCEEIAILIQCSSDEIETPSKLFLDIRSFPDFASIPRNFTMAEQDGKVDLDTKDFAFDPGGPSTINMFRAYYKWQIITDLVRPYISNVKIGDDGSQSYFLIVATTAYKNEAYPQ